MEDEKPSGEPKPLQDQASNNLMSRGKVLQPLSADLEPATIARGTTSPAVPQPTLSSSPHPQPNPASSAAPPTPPSAPNAAPASVPVPPDTSRPAETPPQQADRAPVGVYVIAAIILLGAGPAFLGNLAHLTWYSIVLGVDVLVAIGLLFRRELARVAMVAVSVLLLVVTIINGVNLFNDQHRINQATATYQSQIAALEQQKLTPVQQAQLASLRHKAASTQNSPLGSIFAIGYLNLAWNAAQAIVVMVYLTRPRVKDSFYS
ncbi:MAG TPA: hypothetical protein VLF91_04690 [Candidatus Saccharimonadales bacterium]|nr:hypothetical protein [Candidatus Saccharimonadales bacterium]